MARGSTDGIGERLDRLEQRQEALVQGVTLMNETLGIHSAMLEQILTAATQPPSNDLTEALERIGALLADQTKAVRTLEASLTGLPERIAAALAQRQ